MIRRPPRSTLDRSSAASAVYKRQHLHFAALRLGALLFDHLKRIGSAVPRDDDACVSHLWGSLNRAYSPAARGEQWREGRDKVKHCIGIARTSLACSVVDGAGKRRYAGREWRVPRGGRVLRVLRTPSGGWSTRDHVRRGVLLGHARLQESTPHCLSLIHISEPTRLLSI